MTSPLTSLDWIIVAAYFGVVFGVALVVTLRSRGNRDDSQGYFLAGRNIGWIVIGASLFASNIGSEHLVGLAGSGASQGIAVAQFEVLASLILLVLGWIFVPFYLRSCVMTMPEFLERRYSEHARWYLAIVSIAAYVLTKISVTIAAGGIVFKSLMGIDFWTGALLVVVFTGLYTLVGGMRAVLYTDVLQSIVLIGGSIVVTICGLNKLGGIDELTKAAGPEAFQIWKSASDPDFPWTGILLGAPILGVWYWCTDQFIVQRVLAAKDQDNARRGTILGGYLKLLPLFICVIPGIIAKALANKGELPLVSPDEALPSLVANVLPMGLRGLVVAGLLAALMSSLSSVFNSCSTLITWDIYRKIRPKTSEKQLVVIGQITTVGLVVAGLLWIPFMQSISDQLYKYLQSVQAYIAPPIAAVFLLGVTMKRVNARGAMASLLVGFVLGTARLLLEINQGHLPPLLHTYATMNFLHFAAVLFVICSVTLVAVSFTAPAPSRAQLAGMTLAHREGKRFGQPKPWYDGQPARWDIAASLLLVGVVGLIWWVFR